MKTIHKHSKKWNTNLILASVLFVLGSLGFWIQYHVLPSSKKKQEQKEKVFQWSTLQKIEIFNEGRKTLFECFSQDKSFCNPEHQGEWRILEPLQTQADPGVINILLSGLKTLKSVNTIDLPKQEQWLDYGFKFDPSTSTPTSAQSIRLNFNDHQHTLFIGKATPVGPDLYVYSSRDKKILVLPNTILQTFEQRTEDWRSKRLLSLNESSIRGIALESPTETLLFKKENNKFCFFKNKICRTLDQEEFQVFLNQILFVTLESVIEENSQNPSAKKKLSSLNKLGTIQLQTDQENVDLQFYSQTFRDSRNPKNSKQLVYLLKKGAPELTQVDTVWLDRFKKTEPDYLQQRLLSSSDRFGIQSLRVEKTGGSRPFVLDSEWRDQKWWTQGKSESSEAITFFVDQLTKRSIIRQISEAEASQLQNPSQELLRVQVASSTKHFEYLFWRLNDQTYVQFIHQADKEIYLLDSWRPLQLIWSLDTLTQKQKEIEDESRKRKSHSDHDSH